MVLETTTGHETQACVKVKTKEVWIEDRAATRRDQRGDHHAGLQGEGDAGGGDAGKGDNMTKRKRRATKGKGAKRHVRPPKKGREPCPLCNATGESPTDSPTVL